MKRLLAMGAALLAVAGFGSVHLARGAAAASTDVAACQHLHLTYSFTSAATDTPIPVSVLSSQCSFDAGLATAATGGGTVTFLSVADNSLCAGSLLVVCGRYSLDIPLGGALVAPTFSTTGAAYFEVVAVGPSAVPSTLFDYGTAETITAFAAGHGSGALNTICTFSNPVESCTADGSFVWEPGT